MELSEKIPISSASVRAGEIYVEDLAQSYLQALATLTETRLIGGEPEHIVETDWSDYEYPSHKEYYQWGSEQLGMRILVSGRFSRPGVVTGSNSFWIFHGLPPGITLSGVSQLSDRWSSSAALTIELTDETSDSELYQRALAALADFRDGLKAWNLSLQPDGPARAVLEDLLTDLCWYGKALNVDMIAPLQAAANQVDLERPAGASVRYLLAVVKLENGDIDGAAQLLEDLAKQGKQLHFSHGINYGQAPGSEAGQVVWQDNFPAPAPYHEVRLGLARVAELRDDQVLAQKLYTSVARAKQVISSDQAKAGLKRLKLRNDFHSSDSSRLDSSSSVAI